MAYCLPKKKHADDAANVDDVRRIRGCCLCAHPSLSQSSRPYKCCRCVVTYVLGSSKSHSSDAGDAGEVELLNSLSCLLLVTGMNDGSRAGSTAVAYLDLGVGAVVVFMLLDRDLLRLVIGQFLDPGVGHIELSNWWGSKLAIYSCDVRCAQMVGA